MAQPEAVRALLPTVGSCGPVAQRHSCRAEWNKAPSMYEMEGALPGLATLSGPVARLAWRRVPPAGASHPREGPVS